jgi:putative methyltransferase
MIRPGYDPAVGKTGEYAFDLPAYFRGEPLRRVPVRVHFRDTALGPGGRYPLVPGDLKAFAKAAVGPSYPVSRIRHYQHQLDVAQVVRGPVPREPVTSGRAGPHGAQPARAAGRN